ARTNRVLWINSIGLRRPSTNVQDASRILNKVRKFTKGPVSVHPTLHVLTPLAIPYHDLPGVPAVNAWILSRHIRMQVKKLGLEPFQLWTFMPTTAPLVRQLRPDKVIYYCVDEWSAFSFLNGELMRRMEKSLIAQSDLVVTSAEKLYASKCHLHPNTHMVPHGVDTGHFAQARRKTTSLAPELKNLPRPIIGFWGIIQEWIDIDLIYDVATRHSEWSVALVGKIDTDCSRLKGLNNVHLIGARTYESLPSFAKGFDVAILPFKVNRLTESVNPIKLREYLATGLPVVSTALPEVKRYASVVRIGETHDDFVQQLEAAVLDTSEASAERRMVSVSHESWEARVETLSRLIESLPPKSKP
ncbi:MAG TPA: glycosyltransferase, partial [Nitrospiraceae bacterium]|nr:glycosyltransferase [Nitrospiraceae bacterium]